MSKKGVSTTAEIIEWGDIERLIECAIANKIYNICPVIIFGSFLGLKVGDILKLKWKDALSDTITLKCNKDKRMVTIPNNKFVLKWLRKIYVLVGCPSKDAFICESRKGKGPLSVQRANVILKDLKGWCGMDYINNLSTISFRKTFGRHIYDLLPENQKESCILMLGNYFGHSSPTITRKFIGIETIAFKDFEDLMVTAEEFESVNKMENNNFVKPSYVYLMKDSALPELTKIGKSNQPYHRERTLQGEKPTISMYKYTRLKNEEEAFKFERMLHDKYDDKRVRGEWFKINDDDLFSLIASYEWIDAR